MSPFESHPPGLDRAIDELANDADIKDPDRLTAVLRRHPSASAFQLHRLWQVAVRQSTLAEVQIAMGVATCQAREWHPGWVAAQDVLRNALTDNVGADTLQAKLESYIDERRAMTAHLPFVKFVRQLESLFAREQSLMGFHFADDENAYRQREARLGERLCAPGTSADERISVARAILNERARYQSIYLQRLDAVAMDVTKAFSRCEALLTFFSERTRPEVHRWHALTADLLTCRAAARKHILNMLELDSLAPHEVLSGQTRSAHVEGKVIPVLAHATAERFGELLQLSLRLLADGAQREQVINAERRLLVQRILGEANQSVQQQSADADTAGQDGRPSYPLERKSWYRLAKICWWMASVVWVLLCAIVTMTFAGFATAAIVGGVVLYGLKAGMFYVVSGRTIVREPAASGFIALDMFERILADADRQGQTISVASVRTSMMAAKPPHISDDQYLVSCERWLLGLEVTFGAEIPVSVVEQEADALPAAQGRSDSRHCGRRGGTPSHSDR